MVIYLFSFVWWAGGYYVKSKIWHIVLHVVDNKIKQIIFKPKNPLRLEYRYTEQNLLDYFNSV